MLSSRTLSTRRVDVHGESFAGRGEGVVVEAEGLEAAGWGAGVCPDVAEGLGDVSWSGVGYGMGAYSGAGAARFGPELDGEVCGGASEESGQSEEDAGGGLHDGSW